jgi:hypothetical protein
MAGKRRSSGVLWNLLTVLVLVGAVCVVSYFVMIFVNPQSALNPFPPPTLPPMMVLPTSTPTSIAQLPPTWTPEPTREPTLTLTPGPTQTPTRTPTQLVLPSPLPPTETPTATATQPPEFLLSGGVQHRRSTAVNGLPCTWMGVGGNIVDLDGNPVQGLTVLLGGAYETKPLNKTVLSGTAPVFGEGGYEIQIADDPGRSNNTMYVQLFSPTGLAVSPQYFFSTYDECERNLIQLNFAQSQ